jgi:hypothetical protein
MSTTPSNPPMFSDPVERSSPMGVIALVGVGLVILVAVIVMLGRRHLDPPSMAYAPNIALSDFVMSESTSLSGGKSTYIDGRIANHGHATVVGVWVKVFFRNDDGMPPQVESLPMTLIRTRTPYVDTQAVKMEPGDEREFRLIFENIGSNWNQQQPEIQITGVQTR